MSYTNKDFNPSNSTQVALIKDAAESLAECIEKMCPEGALKDKAIIDVQSASMFAVKKFILVKDYTMKRNALMSKRQARMQEAEAVAATKAAEAEAETAPEKASKGV